MSVLYRARSGWRWAIGIARSRLQPGLATIAAADELRWPVEVCAALIGGAVGLWPGFEPDLVGGGDAITQATLAGTVTLSMLPLAFLLRFGLGAVSCRKNARRTVRTHARAGNSAWADLRRVQSLGVSWDLGIQPEAFAVIGMAAFFTGVVRAPMTGIVLVIRNDSQLYIAFADAGGLLCGDGCPNPAVAMHRSTSRCRRKPRRFGIESHEDELHGHGDCEQADPRGWRRFRRHRLRECWPTLRFAHHPY